MGELKTALDSLNALLRDGNGLQELQALAVNLDAYSDGIVAAQKTMITDLNTNMLKTFSDSMAMYNDMVTGLQASFAQIAKDPEQNSSGS